MEVMLSFERKIPHRQPWRKKTARVAQTRFGCNEDSTEVVIRRPPWATEALEANKEEYIINVHVWTRECGQDAWVPEVYKQRDSKNKKNRTTHENQSSPDAIKGLQFTSQGKQRRCAFCG
jgi:hypothetical protein